MSISLLVLPLLNVMARDREKTPKRARQPVIINPLKSRYSVSASWPNPHCVNKWRRHEVQWSATPPRSLFVHTSPDNPPLAAEHNLAPPAPSAVRRWCDAACWTAPLLSEQTLTNDSLKGAFPLGKWSEVELTKKRDSRSFCRWRPQLSREVIGVEPRTPHCERFQSYFVLISRHHRWIYLFNSCLPFSRKLSQLLRHCEACERNSICF